MVYRIALSFLKNTQDAEDAVQIVFIKLIDGKDNIIPRKERALLTQTTVSYCKDVLRSFWKRHTEELNEDFLFEEQLDRELFHTIMSLPDNALNPITLNMKQRMKLDIVMLLLLEELLTNF